MGILLNSSLVGEGGEERGVDMSLFVDFDGSQGAFDGKIVDNILKYAFWYVHKSLLMDERCRSVSRRIIVLSVKSLT
jgi:hypothetical protein